MQDLINFLMYAIENHAARHATFQNSVRLLEEFKIYEIPITPHNSIGL